MNGLSHMLLNDTPRILKGKGVRLQGLNALVLALKVLMKQSGWTMETYSIRLVTKALDFVYKWSPFYILSLEI
jgi:hypothetical protein